MVLRLVAIASAAVFATTPAVTAAAATTLFARLGDVDRQGTSIELFAIERADGRLGFFGRAHGDEAEATGPAAGAIHNQIGFANCAVSGKRVMKFVLGCVVGKIYKEKFIVLY